MLLRTAITDELHREPLTHWYTDEYADLYVWFDSAGAIAGFQLCYNKSRDEHSLTWKSSVGYAHNRIDAGDDSPLRNQTPVVLPDGLCPLDQLRREFARRADKVEPAVREFISAALDPVRHPELRHLQ